MDGIVDDVLPKIDRSSEKVAGVLKKRKEEIFISHPKSFSFWSCIKNDTIQTLLPHLYVTVYIEEASTVEWEDGRARVSFIKSYYANYKAFRDHFQR